MVDAAFAQCGHCISLNSTIVTAAFAAPLTGPFKPFSSLPRASSKGFAPKGRMSPVNTCLPSALTSNRLGLEPFSSVITTETSASPGTSDGRISAIFHVLVESKPSIWNRKELTVSSVGRTVVPAAVGEVAAGLACKDGGVWATTMPDNMPDNRRDGSSTRCRYVIFWNFDRV